MSGYRWVTTPPIYARSTTEFRRDMKALSSAADAAGDMPPSRGRRAGSGRQAAPVGHVLSGYIWVDSA